MAASVGAATLVRTTARGFLLSCNDGAVTAEVWAVDARTTRFLLYRAAEQLPPTWTVLPDPDAAASGPSPRSRDGSALPSWPAADGEVSVTQLPGGAVQLRTSQLTLTATLSPSLSLAWTDLASGRVFAQDRLSRAYALSSAPGGALLHAQRRAPGEQYFGLCDKTGPLDLAGRRLRCESSDALGFDPARGDPLYKHWPLLLVRTAAQQGFVGVSPEEGAAEAAEVARVVYGVWYDNGHSCAFDLGCENSNYHGPYRGWEAAGGVLDCYTLLGPTLPAVTSRFVALTGRTLHPPRWSLGYGMTAMPLADAADAQARIGAFVARCGAEGVPASSFHFGSGYTLHGGKRLTFQWNAAKFPEPEALIAAMHAAGLRVVANVKPCLLREHPAYHDCAQQGRLLLAQPSGPPATALFWDGDGGFVDFLRPGARSWWAERLAADIMGRGVDAAWNDNNEYELPEPGVWAGGEDSGAEELRGVRPAQALLMASLGLAAARARAPAERPFSISRAGGPGLQRYAGSWSGDNESSWAGLRWGLRTLLQMSISGLFNVGADVGGFAGPVPPPELLVRWYQCAALTPRCVSNSWKACGTVTSPWLHPGKPAAACIWALRLRYRLLPYMSGLMRAASERHEPPLRPLFWHFPDAARAWEENDEFMLGPCLIAAPVVADGARSRSLALPCAAYCFYSGELFSAGRAEVPAPLHRMPLFCPVGAMLPLTQPAMGAEGGAGPPPHDEPSRILRLFPFPPAACEREEQVSCFDLAEDDGLSAGGGAVTLRLRLVCGARTLSLSCEVEHSAGTDGARFQLPYSTLLVSLPPGETRPLDLRVSGEAGLMLERGAFLLHSL